VNNTEFSSVAEQEFERHFIHILDHSSKDSDYKLALARFLLDYTKEEIKPTSLNNVICVSFDTVAKYFLRYYWNQTKLRHTPKKMYGEKERVLEVVKIMERWLGSSYMPSFEKIYKNGEKSDVQNCISEIREKCFHDVVPRFQYIKRGKNIEEHEIFFKYKATVVNDKHKKIKRKRVDLDYGIILNPNAVEFLQKHHDMLSKFVTLEWARFLEKINPGIPRLVEKAEGTIKRGSLSKYRKILKASCPMLCFYCNEPFGEKKEKKYEVDHLIPFSYIAEDSFWNLVPACRECNCSKLGLLPARHYVQKLVERNNSYRSKIAELEQSLRRLDLDFERVLNKYYENALDNGFMIWDGSRPT